MSFLGLEAEEYDRHYSTRLLLGRILQYFRPYKRVMAVVIGFLALNSLVGALIPLLLAYAINFLQVSNPSPTLVFEILFSVLALNLVEYVFNYYSQRNAVWQLVGLFTTCGKER